MTPPCAKRVSSSTEIQLSNVGFPPSAIRHADAEGDVGAVRVAGDRSACASQQSHRRLPRYCVLAVDEP